MDKSHHNGIKQSNILYFIVFYCTVLFFYLGKSIYQISEHSYIESGLLKLYKLSLEP